MGGDSLPLDLRIRNVGRTGRYTRADYGETDRQSEGVTASAVWVFGGHPQRISDDQP
jgi:hypothetical protein